MSNDEITTVVDLLKQSYMEQDWKLVLECIEILQTEEDEDYQDEEFDDLDF
tara:strand:- start:49 stop:201 length:153 start_codon:yes stop_codon:yes gene_type:complete